MRTAILLPLAALFLSSCDKAKAFIDPTGRAYGGNGSTAPSNAGSAPATPAKTSSTGSPAPAAPPPPPPTSGARVDVPVRMPAEGRTISESEAIRQVPGIEFSDPRGTWTFRNGLARVAGGLESWVDSAGKPWALGIGDLDLDGSDYVVLLVRWDKAGSDTKWELAYLRNQGGRLFNTQTIDLPGSAGFREVVVDGSSVTLVPVDPGPNVFAGYSGGRLALSGR